MLRVRLRKDTGAPKMSTTTRKYALALRETSVLCYMLADFCLATLTFFHKIPLNQYMPLSLNGAQV